MPGARRIRIFQFPRTTLTSHPVPVFSKFRGEPRLGSCSFPNLPLAMSQKILVIDDSLASSKAAETALAQGFGNVDVLLAQRGAEGFERFLVAQPDLILLNESLPDMDGEAVVYRLLNDPLTSNVPVVVMSSNGHGEKLKQRYANVVRSIPKPVSAGS